MAFTVRLTPDEEKILNQLKKQIGESTNTKALIKAAEFIVNELPRIKVQLSKVTSERNHYYNHLIKIANSQKTIDSNTKIIDEIITYYKPFTDN